MSSKNIKILVGVVVVVLTAVLLFISLVLVESGNNRAERRALAEAKVSAGVAEARGTAETLGAGALESATPTQTPVPSTTPLIKGVEDTTVLDYGEFPNQLGEAFANHHLVKLVPNSVGSYLGEEITSPVGVCWSGDNPVTKCSVGKYEVILSPSLGILAISSEQEFTQSQIDNYISQTSGEGKSLKGADGRFYLAIGGL